jgi:hypothetical protein
VKRTRRHTDITVRCDGDGLPVHLIRAGTEHAVMQVMEQWDVRGRWWGQESSRRYILLRTDRGTYEVCLDRNTRRWTLTGVAD